MRILHLTPTFFPAIYYGGPTVSTYDLCRALHQQGVELVVLTTDAAGPRRRLSAGKLSIQSPFEFPVYFCRRAFLTSVSPGLLRRLITLVRWADLVHLTGVYSFPTIPTLFACRFFKKPLVWSPRGALQRWSGTTRPALKAIWEQTCRRVAPKRLCLHVTSEEEERESAPKFPGIPIAIIPNGVEFPQDVSPSGEENNLRLLYLGRFVPKKGIENLLLALRDLDGYLKKSWTLKLAGSGSRDYTRKISRLIEKLGFSRQVQMAGEVFAESKKRIFETTDIVVVPSYTENFGMVVAEALAHGVPVIASKGTPWRRVEEVGCGVWVENDPKTLAGAIERMSRMPLREMGARGRAWIRREFSWDDRGKEMVGLYAKLLEK